MPKRKYTPEEIVAKLRQVDVLLGRASLVGPAGSAAPLLRYFVCPLVARIRSAEGQRERPLSS
jgi:hypothetical protein